MKHHLLPIGVGLAVILTGFSSGAEPKKSPAVILLIRHAEKPDDVKTFDLSPAGYKRAAALPGLFAKSADRPAPFPTPDAIFAAKDSTHSHRCTETVAPLAKKIGHKVHKKVANDDFAKLTGEIFDNPKYAGKTVLICWHHGNLPSLAKTLGAKDAPDRFKGSVFDRVWRISFDPSGKTTFEDLPERLMPGDAKK